MDEMVKKLKFPDLSRYAENRQTFPVDELNKYAGMYVAWSPDGTRIVACGKDRESLWQALEDSGIDFNQVVGEFIPPHDTAILY